MRNNTILKQASIELSLTNDNDFVKIAGITSKIWNWLKQFFSEEYKNSVLEMRDNANKIIDDVSSLAKSLNTLEESIKDADVKSYNNALVDVKKLISTLYRKLESLNRSATSAQNKLYYSLEDYKEGKHTSEDYELITGLPIGENIYRPVSDFEHFNKFTENDIIFKESSIERVTSKINDALIRAGADAETAGNITSGKNIILLRNIIAKSILEKGILVDNRPPPAPNKKTGPVVRAVNQRRLVIRVEDIKLPGVPYLLSMNVLLLDMSATHGRPNKMSVMNASHIAVKEIRSASRKELLLKLAQKSNVQVPLNTTTLPKVKGIEKTTVEFRKKLIQIANELGVHPDWLATIISFESAGTFSPSIKNKNATGLIQFMPRTAKGLGTTTDDLAKMTPEAQLDYVKMYFMPYKGRLKSLGDMYLATLYPKAIGMNLDEPMFSYPSKVYMMNKGFDRGKTGVITPRMVVDRINRHYASAKGNRINVDDASTIQEKPKEKPISQPVLQVDNTQNQQIYNHINENTYPINDNEYNQILRTLFANHNYGPLEKIVRNSIANNLLPSNEFTIIVQYNNAPEDIKTKFNNVLSTALISELNAKTSIYKKANGTNISCKVVGSTDVAYDAVQCVCDGVSTAFNKILNNYNIKASIHI